MKDRLNKIHKFLCENRQYNKELQEKYYLSWVCPYEKTSDKVISILYKVANTQSQPKINYLADFFKKIHDDRSSLDSFSSFSNYIGNTKNKDANYITLFNNLKSVNGWGAKTSALFVKNIYYMHSNNYSTKLRFWSDTPNTIKDNDTLLLPVDIVISEIFNKIDNTKKWDFKTLNNILREHYTGDDIAVWDDLWFWGFVTQQGSGKDRLFGWNENKYWILEASIKDVDKISEIKDKSIDFLKLLY